MAKVCHSMPIGTDLMEIGRDSMEIGSDSMEIGTDSMRIGTDSMEIGTHPMEIGTHPMEIGTHSMEIGTHSMTKECHLMQIGTDSMTKECHSMTIKCHSMEKVPHSMEEGDDDDGQDGWRGLVGLPTLACAGLVPIRGRGDRRDFHLARAGVDDQFDAADGTAINRADARARFGFGMPDSGAARGARPGHRLRREPRGLRRLGLRPHVAAGIAAIVVGPHAVGAGMGQALGTQPVASRARTPLRSGRLHRCVGAPMVPSHAMKLKPDRGARHCCCSIFAALTSFRAMSAPARPAALS